MGLVDDYETYFLKYTKLYGEKTAVFYQVGKFHEIYGIDNEQEKMGNVSEIAPLLNLKETRENPSILENNRKNAIQAGFNSVSIDRNIDLLVSYGYTVVVVNQIPGTTPMRRAVEYIVSPSTNLNSRLMSDPYLISVYLDQLPNRSSGGLLRYIGMTAMDTSTGTTWFYETNDRQCDQSLAADDLMRFIQTFAPVEVILAYSKSVPHSDARELVSSWGFNTSDETISGLKPVVYLKHDELPTAIEYAETYLNPIFKDRGCLNILDYIGMSRYRAALQSYLYILTFCEVHNRLLLTGLPLPRLWENNSSLVLDNSSIMQLGISESYYEKQETVLSMLSASMLTPMGRRLLRERLLNPITDVTELQRRYDLISTMQETVPTLIAGENIRRYEIYRKGLKGVRDFDRLHRKIALGTLCPSEFHTLHTNYQQLLLLIDDPDFKRYVSDYTRVLDIDAMGACTVLESLETNLFLRGNYGAIDTITDNLAAIALDLDQLCAQFPDAKYHEDEGGAYLSLTKPQFQRLKKGFVESLVSWKDLQIDEKNKSNVKIRFDRLSELFSDRQSCLADLRTECIVKYKEFLKSINLQTLRKFTTSVAEVDLSAGMAYLSISRSYCKPQLYEGDVSFIETVALRHPLVERSTRYVAHDVALGSAAVGASDCPAGILLYGVNQTGKSCTMKSLGIAVVMAQAGLFVSATHLRLRPYEIILTRILNNDNLSRGLSTFAIEMLELRSILRRCNNRTLVLGDEVCHGTETASAVSLVGASIMHMSRTGTNFIFATHLHELSVMPEICQLENVRQCHLSISFQGSDIIYERQMKEGAGTKLYGLEVARFLRIAEPVMNDAYKIRDKYYTQYSTVQQSTYNKDVYLTKCAICDKKAVEVHHINFQSESNEHGLVGNMHINQKANLVQLCLDHHRLVHDESEANELIILGYQPTNRLEYYIRPRLKSLQPSSYTLTNVLADPGT